MYIAIRIVVGIIVRVHHTLYSIFLGQINGSLTKWTSYFMGGRKRVGSCDNAGGVGYCVGAMWQEFLLAVECHSRISFPLKFPQVTFGSRLANFCVRGSPRQKSGACLPI